MSLQCPRPDGAAATHDAFARSYTLATYTSQKRDAGTGLMYYGARWCDLAIGRFIQPDSLVPEPGVPSTNRATNTRITRCRIRAFVRTFVDGCHHRPRDAAE